MDIALDTGVFLGYAHEPLYEPHHTLCHRILKSSTHNRFLSLSVDRELERRVRQRKKLYEAMALHVAQGRRLADFDLGAFNGSDAALGRRVMREVGRAHPVNVVTFLRLERLRFATRIDEAMDSVQQGRIAATTDYVLEAGLRAIPLGNEDARNVCEYMQWALDRAPSAFVTADGPLAARRTDILSYGRRHFDREDPPWDVLHVSGCPL